MAQPHDFPDAKDAADSLKGERQPPPYGTADPDRENHDPTDMSKPPTGHHPGEGDEAERNKYFGPDHMREELNPTTGGDRLNKGQERRDTDRRQR